MSDVSIDMLRDELQDILGSVPSVRASGFTVMSLDHAQGAAGGHGMDLPMAMTAYHGCEVRRHGNSAIDPVDGGAYGAAMLDVEFGVYIAVDNRYAEQGAPLLEAYKVLDEVRRHILGYRKVNRRPWRFMGERPEPEVSGDGFAMFSQFWRTTVVFSGNQTTKE